MKISVIGTGYVGLVTGTCFSEFGFHVTCIDINQEKISQLNQGICPIYEPGLEDLIQKNSKAGRLVFSTDASACLADSDVVFIAVGTPTGEDGGHADLQYVFSAAEEIARSIKGYTVIVTKSTVPVDTNKKLQAFLKEKTMQPLDVVSNPEFLREGSAVEDFMKPDRVVVGCATDQAMQVMKKLYSPLSSAGTPVFFTDPSSAEMIKYASNSFLATKIAFINQVADLCEKCGANIESVAKGVGLDSRIGSKFLQVGPGYGGSCFPKDTLAMAKTAQEYKAPLTIVEAVIESNAERKQQMAQKIVHACGESIKGKSLAILGLTFKPETDDMRDSPSLVILPALEKEGALLRAYDPVGTKSLAPYFQLQKTQWFEDAYACAEGADALIILTEWNEFRSLDKNRLQQLMRAPVIIDLRNMYSLEDMENSGFAYHSLGRLPVLA